MRIRPHSVDDGSGMSHGSTRRGDRRLPRPFATLATLVPFVKPAAAVLAASLLLSCGGGGGDSGGAGTLPQAVTLTFPANGTDGLSGIVTLGAAAAAGAGIVAVEFQIDGVAIGAEDTTAPYAASLDTTPFVAGQHVIRARGRDAAGSRTPWSSAVVRLATGRAMPAGFTRNESWVGGLANASAFALAPDGRLFVAEQGGNLRVVKNGALLGLPFVSLNVDSSGERGLIGVAVHPDFASNHFVYVYYTRVNGAARNNRVVRYIATGDVATDPGTLILELPDLNATNHNGGALHFGPDGKLYVGVGENGNPALAQDRSHPFGKILRINDDGSTPGDNPFAATQTGLGRLVWAYGLRNPFTFAFQPGTGRMHINDVGEQTWEEIDLGAAGANYGWPNSEGFDNVGTGVSAPLFAYGHAAATGGAPGGFFSGRAIAGGTFYPTSGPSPGLFPPPWRGNYFFADYLGRFVGLLDSGNDNAAYAFCTLAGNPVDMLVGSDAALYVLTRGAIARISTP